MGGVEEPTCTELNALSARVATKLDDLNARLLEVHKDEGTPADTIRDPSFLGLLESTAADLRAAAEMRSTAQGNRSQTTPRQASPQQRKNEKAATTKETSAALRPRQNNIRPGAPQKSAPKPVGVSLPGRTAEIVAPRSPRRSAPPSAPSAADKSTALVAGGPMPKASSPAMPARRSNNPADGPCVVAPPTDGTSLAASFKLAASAAAAERNASISAAQDRDAAPPMCSATDSAITETISLARAAVESAASAVVGAKAALKSAAPVGNRTALDDAYNTFAAALADITAGQDLDTTSSPLARASATSMEPDSPAAGSYRASTESIGELQDAIAADPPPRMDSAPSLPSPPVPLSSQGIPSAESSPRMAPVVPEPSQQKPSPRVPAKVVPQTPRVAVEALARAARQAPDMKVASPRVAQIAPVVSHAAPKQESVAAQQSPRHPRVKPLKSPRVPPTSQPAAQVGDKSPRRVRRASKPSAPSPSAPRPTPPTAAQVPMPWTYGHTFRQGVTQIASGATMAASTTQCSTPRDGGAPTATLLATAASAQGTISVSGSKTKVAPSSEVGTVSPSEGSPKAKERSILSVAASSCSSPERPNPASSFLSSASATSVPLQPSAGSAWYSFVAYNAAPVVALPPRASRPSLPSPTGQRVGSPYLFAAPSVQTSARPFSPGLRQVVSAGCLVPQAASYGNTAPGSALRAVSPPLVGSASCAKPACSALLYVPDLTDPLDGTFALALTQITVQAKSRLTVRRLAVGRYEIDGRLLTLSWGLVGGTREVFVHEDCDTVGRNVPLHCYLAQAAHVALSVGGNQQRTVRIDDKKGTLDLDVNPSDRKKAMRLACEEASSFEQSQKERNAQVPTSALRTNSSLFMASPRRSDSRAGSPTTGQLFAWRSPTPVSPRGTPVSPRSEVGVTSIPSCPTQGTMVYRSTTPVSARGGGDLRAANPTVVTTSSSRASPSAGLRRMRRFASPNSIMT